MTARDMQKYTDSPRLDLLITMQVARSCQALHATNRNHAGAAWLQREPQENSPSPPTPFLRLFATFLSLPPRGTDSHTSRVSIKRRRKSRAFLDRRVVHVMEHNTRCAPRGKRGAEGHTCASRRSRTWAFCNGKCHRGVSFEDAFFIVPIVYGAVITVRECIASARPGS